MNVQPRLKANIKWLLPIKKEVKANGQKKSTTFISPVDGGGEGEGTADYTIRLSSLRSRM